MLVAKIYGLIWVFAAALGTVLFVTDSFSPAMTIIYGFIIAFLGGTALLVVFPVLMSERHAPAYQARKPIKTGNPVQNP